MPLGNVLTRVVGDADKAARTGARYGAREWRTGFTPLDGQLGGGVRAGELVLVGGPQGLGKTAFALQLARNVVADGGHATYVCFEHDESTLLQRLVALEAGLLSGPDGLGLGDIRRAFASGAPAPGGLAERLRPFEAAERALDAVLGYGDRLRLVSASGRSTGLEGLRSAATDSQPGVLVVDYLQKVAVPGAYRPEDERVTEVVEGLKDLALDARIPVVAIVAADKQGLGAGRTYLHDLRGSTALAYEADVALMLNDKYDVVARHHLVYDLTAAQAFKRWVVVTIAKNRGGMDGVDLEFRKHLHQSRFDPDGQVVAEQLVDERVHRA